MRYWASLQRWVSALSFRSRQVRMRAPPGFTSGQNFFRSSLQAVIANDRNLNACSRTSGLSSTAEAHLSDTRSSKAYRQARIRPRPGTTPWQNVPSSTRHEYFTSFISSAGVRSAASARASTARTVAPLLHIARLLAAAVLSLTAGTALPSDFFGPSQGLQLQPELDVFQELTDNRELRLLLKVLPTFIPSQSYSEMGAGLYLALLVSPIIDATITPDLTRRRRLDLRLGLEWYPSLDGGSVGASNILQAEAEGTARLVLPVEILATLRYRVEARWQLAEPTSFVWRLRLRPQLEREFAIGGGLSLTPFGNVEFIWSTKYDMWDQFRMQAGLQLGAYWFGKGQVIELNGSVFTFLQPGRSHSPVLGVVWYQYF
jgi:hypothetical protein